MAHIIVSHWSCSVFAFKFMLLNWFSCQHPEMSSKLWHSTKIFIQIKNIKVAWNIFLKTSCIILSRKWGVIHGLCACIDEFNQNFLINLSFVSLKPSNGTWYVLETNYDPWKPPLFLDDRRTPVIIELILLSYLYCSSFPSPHHPLFSPPPPSWPPSSPLFLLLLLVLGLLLLLFLVLLLFLILLCLFYVLKSLVS